MPQTLIPGGELPQISWPVVGGGKLDLAEQSGWRMLLVYRGRHCPLCRRQLNDLAALFGEYQSEGIFVAAVSCDPQDRAEADVAEGGWPFPVGYGLTPYEVRRMGLFLSEPRSPQETDRPFAEPGLFVLNPQSRLQIIDVSNAPFARPDLRALLNGIKFVAAKDYPIRGTA